MTEVAEPKRTKRPRPNLPRIVVLLEEAPDVVGIGLTTIDALEKRGDFPKRRQFSDRRVGYLMRELEEWAETRPASELLPVPQNPNK